MVRGRPDIIQDVQDNGYSMSKYTWEQEWGRTWIPDDEVHAVWLKSLVAKRRKRVARHRFMDKCVHLLCFSCSLHLTSCNRRTLKRTRDEDAALGDEEYIEIPSRKAKRVRIDATPNDKWLAWKETVGKERRGFPKPPPPRPYRKFCPVERLDPDPVHNNLYLSLVPEEGSEEAPEDDSGEQPEEEEYEEEEAAYQEEGEEYEEEEASYQEEQEEYEEEEQTDDDESAHEEQAEPQVLEETPPPGQFTQRDWENEVSQLTRFSNANWRGRNRHGWHPAGDALKPADREPISWLGYEKAYGVDETRRAAAKGQLWTEWDDDLTELNPFR